MASNKPLESLVLDATPLITQSASALQQYASKYYTTPGVKAELRDDNARNQLLLWGDALVVRQPKQKFIDSVSSFAKLTGDYSVLSMNDVHIIALAYELESEKNGGANLRSYPGEKLAGQEEEETKQRYKATFKNETSNSDASNEAVNAESVESSTEGEAEKDDEEDDGFQVVTRPKRQSRKQYWKTQANNNKRQDENATEESQTPDVTEPTAEPQIVIDSEVPITEPVEEFEKLQVSESTEDATTSQESSEPVDEEAEVSDEDDDGDWITPGNLQEVMMKDNNESVRDAQTDKEEQISVAISTGDFACQNVSMQIGLKLMNHLSGKQIRSVKNFMYRCHACFKMVPMDKSGVRKHFCPKCGGDTLLRCAVSIDNVTGKVTPHLKSNFNWIRKGQVYSIASPLSKSTQRKQGRAGHQHNKENRHKDLQEPLILREDQKEYTSALEEEARRRRKNEKLLQEYVGGGSADNIISPFSTTFRSTGVRVGRGRNANANKSKKA